MSAASWRAAFGLFFDRRPRWAPTWRGWLALGVCALATGFGVVLGAYPFLAVHQPVTAEILVVEGWIPEYALRECVFLARSSGYKKVFTVGAPVAGAGSPAKPDETYAYVSFELLRKMGLPTNMLGMVPSLTSGRDRTFRCASDLREYLRQHGLNPSAINVVTLGPHARRSRLLFESAFGKSVSIGVIALQDEDYDPRRWWRYSEGVKEMIAESAAYIYARFFFYP